MDYAFYHKGISRNTPAHLTLLQVTGKPYDCIYRHPKVKSLEVEGAFTKFLAVAAARRQVG